MSGPPRVLFLGHSAALSGAELFLLGMLARTRAVHPTVILLEDGPLRGRIEALSITVIVCPMPEAVGGVPALAARGPDTLRAIAAMPRFVVELGRAFAEAQPDLVYTNSSKAHLLAVPALLGRKPPRLMHMHERIDADTYGWVNRAVLRTVAGGAARVIANSEATRASLSRGLRRRAEVVYCPVEVAGVPLATVRTDGRGVSVAMVGRIASWKGQAIAIEAISLLQGRGSGSVSLHVYGDALFDGDRDYGRRCRDLAVELGVDHLIHWHGHVSDVPSAMARHDVVLHASVRPEPMGQVILEAMAAGVPVVAADAGGPRELVTHGVSGWLYPMGDVGAIAAAVSRLAADPALRQRLVDQARERVAGFSYERLLPQWERVVTDAAYSGGRSWGTVSGRASAPPE